MNRCSICGCTDHRACDGGCFWVLPNICSRCAIDALQAAGLSSEWLDLAQSEYSLALLAAAEQTSPTHLPRLWRPGDL